MHRLEPLSLLLGILVGDGADEVVALAVLVDLARVPLDDDLVDQPLGQCAAINSRQVLSHQRWVGQLRHGRLAGQTLVLPGVAVFGPARRRR
jgi:hypothetical protein